MDNALRLTEAAEERDIKIRLIGGIAVALHSPSASHRDLQRDYADIDFVTTGASGNDLDGLFREFGYEPDRRFNNLHGRNRLLYLEASGDKQIDVFVETFEMCHVLPFVDRLGVDAPTVPVAELLLSKIQIVQLNRKDLLDIVALLADHEVGTDDADKINGTQIGFLTGRDWGLWRTSYETLEKVAASLPDLDLATETSSLVRSRIQELLRVLDEAPKTLKWRTRSRIGDRVKWYELPEDPRRNTQLSTASRPEA